MKRQNQQKKSKMMLFAALGVFSLGLVLAVVGMSAAVVKIDEEAIARTPEAILASAGVEDGADVSLPVSYFDQRADECVNLYDLSSAKAAKARQFEWTSCGYEYAEIETGLAEYELAANYLPVATGAGRLLPNKGLDFSRWFAAVEGKSKAYNGTLDLKYTAAGAAEFSYENDEFYPLDEAEFSAGDSVNRDGRNHLFTMSFSVPFTVAGGEKVEITADDDTFVYVGTKLALDMGGIHGATMGRIAVRENGEVYTGMENEDLAYSGITLAVGEGAAVRIFHADRDAKDSVFRLKLSEMKLNIVETQLASGKTGVEVAYDPNEPGYVGPLGESSVFRPDSTKGWIIMATVAGVVIVVASMFIVLALKRLFARR